MAIIPSASAVSAALRRWVNEGWSDVEPNNKDHQAAYILARQTSSRPRASQVLKILAKQKQVVERGHELAITFWTAPNGNFPGCPRTWPGWLKHSARAREPSVGPTEKGSYFVQLMWLWLRAVEMGKAVEMRKYATI